MNPDDLLGMLDLGAPLPDEPTPDGCGACDVPACREAGLPNAVVVDDWGRRRGRELADVPRWTATGEDEHCAADMFAVAFDPRLEFQPCEDECRSRFLQALVETAECQSLRDATVLDDFASELAALHFGEQFAEHKKQTDEEKGKPGAMDPDLAAALAAGKAAAAAGEEVGEMVDAREAGMGMGPGSPSSNDPKAIAEAYKRVRNNPTLRRISELAGRFRRVAQSKQRQKTVHGFDDMVGVEPAGDIGRMLPHELVKLEIPELELDTLRRIAERQALCREYAGVELVGKGPIIVTVDESGSMNGDPGETAKALALALAWIAKRQKRWCALVAYSGDSGERILALPPERWSEVAVCDWLVPFIGYGSDIDVPVRELPRIYAGLKPPPGATDIIMITDAECRLPADLQARFNDWRKGVKARVISLLLNSRPGDLAGVSDECHTVKSLDTGETAIGRVLSL